MVDLGKVPASSSAVQVPPSTTTSQGPAASKWTQQPYHETHANAVPDKRSVGHVSHGR